MLIVTGVKGVVFVGRLAWELMYLPFDLVDVVLNEPRPRFERKPANITYVRTSDRREPTESSAA